MPARKMRVELFDSEGNRYTIAFEGQITRDKALHLLDLVELLGGTPAEGANSGATTTVKSNSFSKFEKVNLLIQKNFPLIWFSSKDIQSVYEQEFKEPISLSTVSTYLARMTSRGLLLRSGGANNLKYKVISNVPQAAMRQRLR
ncbi:hypothetical protein G4O51_09655 [Candidatus Bathyarchaeota archaeon A05DMB-2]|jgi:hypothetical protein|nr:hypothetical protein [Candidatus Bathyarchaeota archaeon A05DMB-2]